MLRCVDVRSDCCVDGRRREEVAPKDEDSAIVVFAANSRIAAEDVSPALPVDPTEPASAS